MAENTAASIPSNTPFKYGSKEVRATQDEKGNVWFVAKDVCDILGLDHVSMSLARIPDNHKGVNPIATPGGIQKMSVIDEPGLYRLILRSDKPKAESFMEWVTSEVLPQIRKYGAYIQGPAKKCASCKRVLPVSSFHKDALKKGGRHCFCKECRLAKIEQQKQQLPGTAQANVQIMDWQTTWDILCSTHSDLSNVVEHLRKEVTAMLPPGHFQPIPKGVDVLEHIHLHYSAMEKVARQINVLSEILMWRSPKVMNGNMELAKPRY